MIKSTLSNLPIYFLSLFSILVGVANWLEKLQQDFLRDDLNNEPKFHLVNRKKICTLIQLGGLGSGVCLFSIRLYWVSGYGGLLWRERPFGVRL